MWKGAGPAGGPTQIRNSKRGLIEAQVMELLPTPVASVANDGETVESWDARRELVKAKGINGNGMGEPLAIAAKRLLPTPSANIGSQDVAEHVLLQTPSVADAEGTHERRGGKRSDELLLPGQAKEMQTNWGPYEPAIRRWEAVLGRPAPSPTEPNAKGNHRLSPKFCEWLMGVPEGWITGVPISRNDQLKACGNGVVPAQAITALADMRQAFERTPTPVRS